MPGQKPMKEDFKTVRARDDVKHHLGAYIRANPDVKVGLSPSSLYVLCVCMCASVCL